MSSPTTSDVEPLRILFVCRAVPNPAGRGVERRAAQHLSALNELGAVTLVISETYAKEAADDGVDLASLPVAEIVIRPALTQATRSHAQIKAASDRLTKLWRAARRVCFIDDRALPDDAARYRQQFSGKFDLLFAFRLSAAMWAESVFGDDPGAPPLRAVDFDDLESVAMQRALDSHPTSRFWRWRVGRDIRWLGQTERRMIDQWDLVTVCSSLDRAKLQREESAAVQVIPNAVTLVTPPPEHAGPFSVLFVGTLGYAPNIEGLTWFIEQVWPKVRAELNTAQLHIVGMDTPPAILALNGQDAILVHGRVRDLDPYYGVADAVIAPIFGGGGTRTKILEAFAYQRAVVSTLVGGEGLGLVDGQTVLTADDADTFANGLITLANDPALRRRLATSGRALVEQNFAAPNVRRTLVSKIRALVAGLGRDQVKAAA